MKAASAAVLAILAGPGPILRADLYTFVLRDGTVLRFTDADIPLTVSGLAYLAGPVFSRSLTKQTVGLDIDTVDITISTGGTGGDATLVNGQPLVFQFLNGAFDGAVVTIQKLFLTSWADTSPGPVAWFVGRVTDVQCGLMRVVAKISAMTDLLNTQMPPIVYQPSCNRSFCDAGCTLSLATFITAAQTVTGTITPTSFGLSGISRADGYYFPGKFIFTSGANAGIARAVKSYVSNVVSFWKPFPYPVVAGDAFSISRGCDKTQSTCSGTYANLANFQGLPYIPTPETAIAGGSAPGGVGSSGNTGHATVGSGSTARLGPGMYQP